jgi:hypothetical protein
MTGWEGGGGVVREAGRGGCPVVRVCVTGMWYFAVFYIIL